ncbi:MAG TPA: low affinity iron permease family protein [Allosphingosinicella sp.]|jgi:low affinity Fe/Cu permease
MSTRIAPQAPPRGETRLERIGCWLSETVADVSAHPFAQLGLFLVCALWYLAGFGLGVLTAILSILAITLSQMVLNRQAVREKEAHRRDVALHAKLDELVLATREARDEVAGIEELEEQEIEELRAGNVATLPEGRRAAAR